MPNRSKYKKEQKEEEEKEKKKRSLVTRLNKAVIGL
jgi:hypothetical protein